MTGLNDEAEDAREKGRDKPRLRITPSDARPPGDAPLLVSRDAAAHRLGVHARTVDRLLRKGALRPVRVGARVLIAADSIEAFIQAGGYAA